MWAPSTQNGINPTSVWVMVKYQQVLFLVTLHSYWDTLDEIDSPKKRIQDTWSFPHSLFMDLINIYQLPMEGWVLYKVLEVLLEETVALPLHSSQEVGGGHTSQRMIEVERGQCHTCILEAGQWLMVMQGVTAQGLLVKGISRGFNPAHTQLLKTVLPGEKTASL